jgi:hypothetical protein
MDAQAQAKRVRLLDRQRTAAMLGITTAQLVRLSRNPVFPKPVHVDAFSVYRSSDEVAAFKEEMEQGRARGWKIPDAFYPWE